MRTRYSPARCCCGPDPTPTCESALRVSGSCGLPGAHPNTHVKTFADAGRTLLLAEGLADVDGVFRSQIPTDLMTVYYEFTPADPRFGTRVGSYGTGGNCSLGATLNAVPSENHACIPNGCFLPVSRTLVFSSDRGSDFEIHYQESGPYERWWVGEGLFSFAANTNGFGHCPAVAEHPVELRYDPVTGWVYYSYEVGPLVPGGRHCPGGTGFTSTVGPNTTSVTACPPNLEISVNTVLGQWGTITEPDDDDGPEALSAPSYPPLATQLANVAQAAGRFVASGLATVSQKEFDRRKAICLACPSNQYDAAQDRCRACGCHLSVKPWSKAESCPHGHWSGRD